MSKGYSFGSRDDFAQFAKGSKAVKALVEKEIKDGSRPGTPKKSGKMVIDKALTAFKVTLCLTT